MRTPLRVTNPGALLALAALSCAHAVDERERPDNVLLLVVDTLRADRLGCYGYERQTSPNVDALAARGMVYERSYAQSCWTVPSMISMMTGVSVTVEETALPDLAVLAETLRRHGLETAAFLANQTLFVERGFERGFDVFDTSPNVNGPELARRFEHWYGGRGDKERPFFAWVQFIDPHEPYAPASEHDVFAGPRSDQPELVERWRSALPRVAELSAGLEPIAFEAAAERMVEESNRYDGEVLAADDGIGRILQTLRAGGDLERTLVIVCSDHGEMLYEQRTQPLFEADHVRRHGGLPESVLGLFAQGHRAWFFEQNWNTPLILAGPGIPQGRSQALCANLDIYPTILDALDLAAPAWLEGTSLWAGAEPGRERIFAHGHRISAVREASGRKLIRYDRSYFLLDGEGPQPVQLFDAAQDRCEGRDLADFIPEERLRLEALLLDWLRQGERDAKTGTTPGMVPGLRELGYPGGDETQSPVEPVRPEKGDKGDN